jgi:hypothetical protein
MSAAPLTVGVIAFACVFGGALLGMLLQRRVLAQRLSTDTKDVVKLGMGLVGTMAALALACCSIGPWPTKGPEAREARDLLRTEVAHALDIIWSGEGRNLGLPVKLHGKAVYDAIEQLQPETAGQRLLQTQILRIGVDLGRLRLLLFATVVITMFVSGLSV